MQECRPSGCVADTSALVALTYDCSEFVDAAVFAFEKLAAYRLPVYVNVSIRQEFLDFVRRARLTEYLLSLPRSSNASPYLPPDFKVLLGKHKHTVDMRASRDELPIFFDREIKSLSKIAATHRLGSGDLWTLLCKSALANKLLSAWRNLISHAGINYVQFGKEIPSCMNRKPDWHGVFSIVESTGIGGADAMILNFLEVSKFPFALSCDFDLAYAALRGAITKTILIPDELYRRRAIPLLQSSAKKRWQRK